MHIEPGVVDGAKMVLAYGTAAAAGGYSLKLAADDLKSHSAISFGVRSVLAVVAVFLFFEVFPHFAVGISEVHFILGTTILLLLGAGPAAVGLTGGLLIQGMFFAPTDILQPYWVYRFLEPIHFGQLQQRLRYSGRPQRERSIRLLHVQLPLRR